MYGPSPEYIGWTVLSVDVSGSPVVKDMYVSRLIVLRSPGANVNVASLTPTLTWDPIPEAASYTVKINITDGFSLVEHVRDLEATSYTVASELLPETNYTWQVDAVGENDFKKYDVGTTRTAFRFTTPPKSPPPPDGTTISGTVYYSTNPLEGIQLELIPDPISNLPVQATTSS